MIETNVVSANMLSSKIKFCSTAAQATGLSRALGFYALLVVTFYALFVGMPYANAQELDVVPLQAGEDAPERAVGKNAAGDYVDELGYILPGVGDSEFDNASSLFVKDWRSADPNYEDSEFGERIYNEASTPTKLEILRLLSKNTPSMLVFLHAIAMGIDIENVLQASVKYEPGKSKELAGSAVNLLPILAESSASVYSGYELEDLEREDKSKPYLVQDVVDRFFDDRLVLRPYPDWFEGQYHFLASAAELKQLQEPMKEIRWYRTKSTINVERRPIFVSLYEANRSVLIDGEERIKKALAEDPEALLPVVFVFNRLRERAIDQLGYPHTVKGAQQAYAEKGLMVTPSPEWQLGEYHMYGQIDEFYEIFNIPEEEDFAPEAWQKLLEEAEDYDVTNTAFLMVVLGGGDDSEEEDESKAVAYSAYAEHLQYAAWDDPRSEQSYPYVEPKDSKPITLKNIMGDGIIFNRPDLLAALNALGVTQVPTAFYYVDSERVKPFVKGAKVLLNVANGVLLDSPTSSSGGGITSCASPPCVEQ